MELLAKFQQLSDQVGDTERTYSYNWKGSRRTSICSIASSPMRGFVFNNLQETTIVQGDGAGCPGSSRHCDHAAAVPAVRRVAGSTGAVLGMVVDAPVVVQRQVPWLGCAENYGVSAVAVLGSSSSWTRLLCPLVQRPGAAQGRTRLLRLILVVLCTHGR